jgi:DNA-binding Lrp family transcriptional regulator
LRLNDRAIDNLIKRSFQIITRTGRNGIIQSKLSKKLKLTSSDGSRLVMRLEKNSLIKREKILLGGRWTYRLSAVKLPVDPESIEQAPCVSCPVEHMCSVDSVYSPNSCTLIERWVLISFSRELTEKKEKPSSLPSNKEEFEDRLKERQQLILREPKSKVHHQIHRFAKNNKR